MAKDPLVIETFDKAAGVYANAYNEPTSIAHSFNIRRQRIYEMVEPVAPPAKILDIGCGPGITIEDLTRRNFEVFGVDMSEKMIEECQKKFGHLPLAHFSKGRIEALEFPDNFFDVVICMGVVEYVENDAKAVQEMMRVLKPGGILLITLPNQRSPYVIWDKKFYRPLYHFVSDLLKKIRGRKRESRMVHRAYTEEGYSALLESQGLLIKDVLYYNFKLVVSPLDKWFPGLTVFMSRKLEPLCRSNQRRLGTGFIVKAKKI